MYTYQIIDHLNAVVEANLEGPMTLVEARSACDDLRRLLVGLRGRRFKILVDARRLQPVSPAVTEEFRAMQEHGLAAGLERAAQLVDSSVVALQRNRISREAGTLSKTRFFRDKGEALQWLIHGDPAPSVPPGPA